ncbi:MAG: lipid IV(A) 3-deoxy-D-manno-octulosonic acid transferase [Betaproteobacteria bacterium]|nr:lipid IV(A) 3-deoxy-D-manno-octulosonic acid transferase [Betaproteobacteria bacterium]
MTRFFYSLLFHSAQPLIWLRLLWRARRQPAYLRHLGERYGFHKIAPPKPLFWLHAVSVGETRAAHPLIAALLAAYPRHALLLTHMTPTGREAGEAMIREIENEVEGAGQRIFQSYLPYDLPGATARFFAHFQPELGLIMETEVWPNLLAAAKKRGIPVCLVNARLSPRSQGGYRRLGALARDAFARFAAVAAQTDADAGRLAALGAENVEVCGNLKFDAAPPQELLERGRKWRREWHETHPEGASKRLIWLAASTREGEEEIVLDALLALPIQERPLLLLVPRHPQRFAEAEKRAAARGLKVARRSADTLALQIARQFAAAHDLKVKQYGAGSAPPPETDVWLGDSMGEMPAYYACADFALIGGSLLPFGGQNLIEAAACACPALVGEHTFNFAQAAEDAIQSGAARRISPSGIEALPQSLLRAIQPLLSDPAQRAAMSASALIFSAAHRGAAQRILALIGKQIPASGRDDRAVKQE